MSGKVTLLDRAKLDLESCTMFLEKAESDELFQDLAAYHIQQAVEKALKFWLSMLGVHYPKTHDVLVLIDKLEGVKQAIPEWLYKNGDLLNEYATKTRYSASIIGTKNKIREIHGSTVELIKRLEPEKIIHPEEAKRTVENCIGSNDSKNKKPIGE
jgi:HEPN domain-containing protein